MEKKAFKVGDKIKNSPTGVHGIVMGFVGGKYVQIKSPAADFYTTWDIADCELSEAYDPKTAFLRDLAELLRKYDAEIDAGCYGSGGESPTLSVTFGDNTIEWTQSYWHNKDFGFPLTADNVLNYDK